MKATIYGVPCRLLVTSALALVTSGCSLIFIKTSSPPSPMQCTSSKVAPILDTLATGYQAVRTGFAVVAPDAAYDDAALSREADAGIGLGLTALFLGSAASR